MNFATHSPAPWRARARRVVDANGAEVCEVHPTIIRPSKDDCWEVAHFIAMAPEMLQVLSDVAGMLPVAGQLHPSDLQALQDRVVKLVIEAKTVIGA